MFLNIGRTGRAGRRGEAITLFTEADMPRIRSIANVVKLSGCEVPDWMLAIKPVSVYLGTWMPLCVTLLSILCLLYLCLIGKTELIYFILTIFLFKLQLNTKEKKQMRKSAPVRRHIDTSSESRAHKPKSTTNDNSGGEKHHQKHGNNKKRRV